MRRKKVEKFHSDCLSNKKLKDVVNILNAYLQEHGPEAVLDIETDEEYGSTIIQFEIYRPETSEEKLQREKISEEEEVRLEEARRVYRKKLFESLKREFGNE